MKKIFTIAIVMCLAFAAHAVKDDWAQLGRYQYQNAQLAKTPDVVFMGNSITDCWVDTVPEFFKENNFLIGVSVDGDKELHDKNRCKSFDKAMNGIELMKKHNVDFNILSVITSKTDAAMLFDFYKRNDFHNGGHHNGSGKQKERSVEKRRRRRRQGKGS